MDLGSRAILEAPGASAELITRAITKGGTIISRGHINGKVAGTRGHLECKGLILQDGPGYDGDSMSGLAASGSQVMFFSTGRGTPAGFPAMPVIKVASNSRVYRAMIDDIDINAGRLIEGKPIEELREEMIDCLVRVINGDKTKAEANGMEVFTMMTVNPPF